MVAAVDSVRQNLDKIGEALKNTKRLVVMTHDNPDPDSVSSAVTLAYIVKKKFNIPAVVRYGGIVGRAENRAMIRVLKLPVKRLTERDFKASVDLALVDAQPKTGNNSFPKNRKPVLIIDHHVLRKTTRADFLDIRTDYGATATMMTEYLLASGLEIPMTIATALSYGISSETQDLGREARQPDIQAYLSLFPKSNKKLLASIEHPRLPRDFFITLSRALHHSCVYRNAVTSQIGDVSNPDLVPFVADFMLRCERINWSICLGRYNGRVIVSIRTTNQKGAAGTLLRRLVGKRGTAGGHGMIAGGQIPCAELDHEKCADLEEELIQEFLKKIGYKDIGELTPLLTPEPIRE